MSATQQHSIRNHGRVAAVWALAACAVLIWPCCNACGAEATGLSEWMSFPSLNFTREHVILHGASSQIRGPGRFRQRWIWDELQWGPRPDTPATQHSAYFVPRTAGLASVLTITEKGEPRIAMGIPVSSQAGLRVIYKTGQYINAFPLAGSWDAGGFGSPALRTMDMDDYEGDWTHLKARFTGELDADEAGFFEGDADPFLSVTLSKLCPGVLFETNTGGFSFFQGVPPYADSVPFAARPGSGANILSLETGAYMELQSPEWLLFFWGAIPPQIYNFHFSITTSVPQDRPPVLFVFSEPPISIENGDNVSLRFAEQDVKAVMFPLFGNDFPKGEETSKWVKGLPADIIARCDEWAKRLAMFPVSTTETYAYDSEKDVIECVTKFDYESVNENGAPWAPLPPTLMLARDRLPLTFEPKHGETVYRTAYGPLAVVDGADTVKWSFSGLAPYVFGGPKLKPSNEQSAGLEQELAGELDKMLSVPYLAPWVYETYRFASMAYVYWRMPGDTAWFLAQTLPVLDEPMRRRVAEYLAAFNEQFPIMTTTALPTWQGPQRARHYAGVKEDGTPDGLPKDTFEFTRNLGDPGKITFNAIRGLDAYYEATGKIPDNETWAKAVSLFEESLYGSDWASGLWTLGNAPEVPPEARHYRMDVELPAKCLHAHLASLIGLLRMSKRCGEENSEAAALAWGRLARGLATRAALAGYAVWLKPPHGFVDYTDPKWRTDGAGGRNGVGNAVWAMNQFAVHLRDSSSGGRVSVFIDYLDLTPEVGRFLHDHARGDITHFLDAVDRGWPLWWTAHMSSELGYDSGGGLQQPMNPHSLFMADAWIRGDSGGKLAKRLDVSWLERGDLFYIHKLAETIKALRGEE